MKLGTVKLGLGNWETEDCEKLETVKLGNWDCKTGKTMDCENWETVDCETGTVKLGNWDWKL